MSKKNKKKKTQSAKVVPIRDGLNSFYNALGTAGLANPYTGMGGPDTKTAGNYFVRTHLNDYEQWEAAYQSNWIARRVVDVVADDATSNWRTIKSENGEEVHRVENEIGLQHSTNEAIRWARLYGGSAILMLTGQDLTKPLNPEKIKKGDLERLVVLDRWAMSSGSYNLSNILSPSFLRPEFYTLAYASSSPTIHHSHFALFYGDPLPIRLLQETQGWGDSILRKGIDQIKQLQAAVNGIAELMQEANVDTIKMAGFAEGITSGEEVAILKRIELQRLGKSNYKISVIDAEDEYIRNTLNLSGVDSSIYMLMTQVCGSYHTPMTKMFGTSARGMNATGEGDDNNYNYMVTSYQNGPLSSSMNIIDEVLVRSALGSMPEDFDYEWNPLRDSDAQNEAQAELLRAKKHVLLKESGLVSTPQIQKELQSNEEYQFDDEDIEELESRQEPDMFEPDPLV
jgi:phage-related protein (TIGR01555 family)